MPTKKKRINITLKKDSALFLRSIALRDDVPEATKASQLIELALEIEEDLYFGRATEAVMRASKGKTISHEAFWSKLI